MVDFPLRPILALLDDVVFPIFTFGEPIQDIGSVNEVDDYSTVS